MSTFILLPDSVHGHSWCSHPKLEMFSRLENALMSNFLIIVRCSLSTSQDLILIIIEKAIAFFSMDRGSQVSLNFYVCVTAMHSYFYFFLHYQISRIFVINQRPCVSSCWGEKTLTLHSY